MSFFENQQRARRKTGQLAMLFLVAVVLITLAIDCLFYLILIAQGSTSLPFGYWLTSFQSLVCSFVVVALIATGSLIRHAALRNGGESVAQLVGAQRLGLENEDFRERQFRNVVEEMAIASGVAMPELFVMESEHGINAFVAGYEPNEAVLVVTRGALDQLTRDELQGVVAHEFSHLLNGDMRLNVRLLAILAGILLLGQVGRFMMRGLSRSRSRWRNGRAATAIVVVGFGLFIIGYIGVFFGRIIKAAVSRQREFLADASAVQFTRQHDGIGGALYKIGVGAAGGALVNTRHAEDLNHMCLGESIPRTLGGLLASHPPISKRLTAIDKTLMARLQARYGRNGQRMVLPVAPPATAPGQVPEKAPIIGSGKDFASAAASIGMAFTPATGTYPIEPGRSLTASAGQLSAASENYAQQLIGRFPAHLVKAVHSRVLAVQLCYALLYEADTVASAKVSAALCEAGPPGDPMAPEPLTIADLQHTLALLGPAARLPCLELAMPALRQLNPEQRLQLLKHLDAMAQEDGRISLAELTVTGFLRKHLGPDTGKPAVIRYRRYGLVKAELIYLLAVMTVLGEKSQDEQKALFRKVATPFLDAGDLSRIETEDWPRSARLKPLYQALQKLNQLSPLLKPAIIDACGDCIIHDDHVSVREYELMRLIADQLDCPLPLLPFPPLTAHDSVPSG